MSERKNNSVLNFFRRNLYYLIIGLALIVTAVVIAAVLLSERNDPVAQNGGGERVIESDTARENETVSSQKTDKPVDKEEESIEEKQSEKEDEKTDTTAKIVFTMPVATADVSKEFTSSTVVYNSTLGVYTGHMGIDFSASEGTDVVAAYGGKIESVTTSYLQGTTVTIDHGNGLKTVYNSIEAEEGLAAGTIVAAGQKIGEVSDNNRQEYKDGPHLHFEVVLNGEKVDPLTYLMIAEK